ncbi:MAG TPA: STAS domain-containing protein [Candidatus Acidoferrales bacterium]|nr:STAS domain-containing protein [Candidatus Acidoferrales bacterium]
MSEAPMKLDGDPVAALREALGRVGSADGEMVLDFSGVRRIEPAALVLLEELAARAGERHVRLALEEVDVNVYQVLKLLKLSPRFP